MKQPKNQALLTIKSRYVTRVKTFILGHKL